LKRAVQICDELASDRYLGTNGHNNASLLKNQITKPQVSFLMEKVLQPDQSNLCRVNFKNVSDVYFSLYQVDYSEYTKMVSKSETELADWLSKKSVHKTWAQKVPDDGFYHQHSAEMEIPALKKGFYVLMLNHQNDFSENGKPFYSSFFVSNIAFINRSPYAKGTLEMYVLDRTVGVPLKNAEVKLWQRRYDYASRTNKLENAATLKSDNEGYLRYEVSSSNYLDYTFTIKTADDFLASDNHIGLYKYNENERERTVTYFFTDRAIYRPGQTVYFKGIKILSKGEQRSLISSANVSVLFRDANYQQISILTLKTNEFGSFHGSFVIPMGLATGAYSLSDNQQGSVNIQVEEYKRPKFEVNIEKPKDVYRVNDLVKVKGNAKALAGFNITNAKVAFRVYRTANYPDWCRWWPGYGTSEEQELNFGTTTTDEKGEFYIQFSAIPDRSVAESSDPTFTYRISAEVTDDAGETRTAEQSIIAGYKTIQFNTQIPELVKTGNKKAWFIGVNNLNGETQKLPVQVKIERLSKNRPLYRSKPWSETDIQLFSEEEYSKKFPLDQYSKQYDLLLLPAEYTVYNKTFNTADTLGFIPEMKSDWTSGQYRVVLTAIDQKGKEIKSVHFFTLYDEKEKESPLSEYMKIYELQASAEPGENAQFLIMSAKKVRVLYEIEHRGKIIKKEWVDLNKEQKILSIPVIEDYRGNIQIYFSTVVDNRSYITSKTLSVPYTNKQLSLKLETFRDKMLPGSKEEWKLNISTLLGEKEAAELLLGMYDASLDAFVPHAWYLNIWNYRYGIYNWNSGLGQIVHGAPLRYEYESYPDYVFPEYEHLNWFGYYFRSYGRGRYYRGDVLMESAGMPAPAAASEEMERTEKSGEGKNKATDKKAVVTGSAQQEQTIITDETVKDNTGGESKAAGTKARSNFNETAFFFPQIKTDENGSALFSFTMPESLTKWRFMALAHTQSLKTGVLTQEVVTQKELMINTFAPRFLREGDELIFTAKVTNLTQKELSGDAILQLKDPVTDLTLGTKFGLSNEKTRFTVKPGQSVPVEWKIKIPVETNLVKYTVKAICADYSDGEENVIPILTNRMLVTETVPLWVNGKDQKSFSLPKLLTNSPTRKNHKLSLEFTSNPAWYAVQSLPYLMEYPYECAEQTFSRIYANSIASHIANSDPKIKAVFDSWKNYEPSALQSKLEKNEELKNVLLEETPWVRDAKNQTERMHRMSILFDINTMKQELASAERKLFMMQTPNGGFPWFAGGRDDRYITQHILAGFGKMRKLGITENESKYRKDIHKAILYLDQRIADDYADLLRLKADMNEDNLGYLQMHYLYTRSFFLDIPIDESVSKEVEYYKLQAAKYWNKKDDYGMGMLAIAMHRNKNTVVSKQIIASLRDRSIYNEELGMYWKGMLQGGYYWYNAPIETMALLIEAFDEVNDDQESIDKMRRWLLKNKQTNDWKTTKATADAIYALLLQGTDYLLTDPGIEIAFWKKCGDSVCFTNENRIGNRVFQNRFFTEQTSNPKWLRFRLPRRRLARVGELYIGSILNIWIKLQNQVLKTRLWFQRNCSKK
jgi:5-hydroxyisourate hydrolase-like protein (transthyretin family)